MGNLTESCIDFGKTLVRHPILTTKEFSRFLINSAGLKRKPRGGISWETHCHTNLPPKTPNGLSDGMPLQDLIDTCFNKQIDILSITDHRHCDSYDYIRNNGIAGYTIDAPKDKRFLFLYKEKFHQRLVVLRAAEFSIPRGDGLAEVNIHGFEQDYPAKKRVTLEDIARFAKDNDSLWIINHPGFYQGLKGREIDKAIELGADAIEMNSLTVPPLIFVNVIAQTYRNKIPIIAGSDAHYSHQIGNALVEFPETADFYNQPIGRIRDLISKQNHKVIFNYARFTDILRMTKEHPPVVPDFES